MFGHQDSRRNHDEGYGNGQGDSQPVSIAKQPLDDGEVVEVYGNSDDLQHHLEHSLVGVFQRPRPIPGEHGAPILLLGAPGAAARATPGAWSAEEAASSAARTGRETDQSRPECEDDETADHDGGDLAAPLREVEDEQPDDADDHEDDRTCLGEAQQVAQRARDLVGTSSVAVLQDVDDTAGGG